MWKWRLVLPIAILAVGGETSLAFAPSQSSCGRLSSTSLYSSPRPLAQRGDWSAYLDSDNTGVVYYFNGKTGESSWEAPPGFPEVSLSGSQLQVAVEKQAEYQEKKEAESKGLFSSLFERSTVEEKSTEEETTEEPEEEEVESEPLWYAGLFDNKAEPAEEEAAPVVAEEEKEKSGFDFFNVFRSAEDKEEAAVKKDSLEPETQSSFATKGIFGSAKAVAQAEAAAAAALQAEEEMRAAKKVEEEKRAAKRAEEAAAAARRAEQQELAAQKAADRRAAAEELAAQKAAARQAAEEERAERAAQKAAARQAAEEERAERAAQKAKARAEAEMRKASIAEDVDTSKSTRASPFGALFRRKEPKKEKPVVAATKIVEEKAKPKVSTKIPQKEVADTTISMDMSSVVLPDPGKISWGGEDAVFMSGRNFGVFDGVSGAVKLARVPLYSKTLASEMKKTVGKSPLSISEMTSRLTEAANFANSGATGASTAIVGSLAEDGTLSVLNLGDCACVVFRDGKAVAKSRENIHSFDCPFQLSEISPDRPSFGSKLLYKVQKGDIVLMASDGVFDNLGPELLGETVSKSPANAGTIARRVADRSRKVSLDKSADTPYAKAASRAGRKEYLNGLGGKVDDISCVVVRCN